jgi:hypothetical protein
MRKLFITCAAAALALSVSGTANATITLQLPVTPGSSTYSGPTGPIFYDFDASTPVYSPPGVVVTGSTPGGFAQPLGSTGNYFSVGPSTSSPGTIFFGPFTGNLAISFIWGSVDTYNTLEFVDQFGNALATFTGNQIFNPANGNQTSPNTNPIVTFLFSGTDVTNLAGMRLSSTQNAFEIDNINVVPEPGTWAMMLLGFGAIGIAMRRRRSTRLTAFA